MLLLNRDNCKKRLNELQHFKGFLPFQFDSVVNTTEREKFLKTIGLWDSVHKKELSVMKGMRDAKPDINEYMDKVLMAWVDENPQFRDCVQLD